MLLNFSKVLIFVSVSVIVIANAHKLNKADVWRSNEPEYKDENEDLRETNGILKRLREDLANINAAERQQNRPMLGELVTRLIQTLQSRLTPAPLPSLPSPAPVAPPAPYDEAIVSDQFENSPMLSQENGSGIKFDSIPLLTTVSPFQVKEKPPIDAFKGDENPFNRLIEPLLFAKQVPAAEQVPPPAPAGPPAVPVDDESTLGLNSISFNGRVRLRRPTVFEVTGECKGEIAAYDATTEAPGGNSTAPTVSTSSSTVSTTVTG